MINYYNFSEFKDGYLLTNDCGKYTFLSRDEMKLFVSSRIDSNHPAYSKLKDNLFIYEDINEAFALDAQHSVRAMKSYLFSATSLHIFVVTKSCNHHCLYCQASVENKNLCYNMSTETAQHAVEIALSSPAQNLSFEFQGGEPLLNFETIKFIIEYAEAKKANKRINYNLVSNLTPLTEEILDFLIQNNVNICTSLDGNEELHNKNRVMIRGNSFLKLTEKIDALKQHGVRLSAIQTTTRYSLGHAQDIVDQYLAFGFNTVFIRPLSPLGFANSSWKDIGYTSEEFLAFYKEALDYILSLAKAGVDIKEGQSQYFLRKILHNYSTNYMELRSPCGGALGQLAYYYNGKIYTCDEARMLAEMGDESFLLGDVRTSSYNDLIENPVCKALSISSCIESLPACSDCVYSPYCGVCPVVNYSENGTLFPQIKSSFRCRVNRGILDLLFSLIKTDDDSIIEIFKRWI